MKDLEEVALSEIISKIPELVEKGLDTLLNPSIEIQISKMERVFLIKHSDSFQYILPNNESGYIKLSQWWFCWSVKWYSNDNGKQIVLLDGVTETEARNYFKQLKNKID